MAKESVGLRILLQVFLTISTFCSLAEYVHAAQKDIVGPPGSVGFGTTVTMLPNGNIVVTDPSYRSGRGAVHLLRPDGTRISTLFGNGPNDHVGSEGIVVLANGNFAVISTSWNNGAVTNAGAVTWVDGTLGLPGAVSAMNSLVGTTAGDSVGYAGVLALTNGNYVVSSILWSNGPFAHVGAATWGNGATGISGAVTAQNSLTGTTPNDGVGGFYNNSALPNGNYVVLSPGWTNGSATAAGAATWGNGNSGITGAVSAANSLVGTQTYDTVGRNGVAVLRNGNYVVSSPWWNNGNVPLAGAATWAEGSVGISGAVSASNSLVGTTQGDYVSESGTPGITALTNGNYVISSPGWNGGIGAATWAHGSTGITGTISASNSLVGTSPDDRVGTYVTALTNGNYVVGSPSWANGAFNYSSGAATLGDGSAGITGPVSEINSLVGSRQGDSVSSNRILALSNGDYVVTSPYWSADAVNYFVGAATWGDGTTGVTGPVSASNSLVGSSANDQIGYNGVAALTNGNYVVSSSRWSNAGAAAAGAVTWANGTSGLTGPVSSLNSLVGKAGDYVGYLETVPLRNGNFVAESYPWNNGAVLNAGAVTWGNGFTGAIGEVSASNSLVGTNTMALVGYHVLALEDGNYIVASPGWSNGTTQFNGAVTLVEGSFRSTGAIGPVNSVVGTAADQGNYLSYAYDAARKQLVVGRPLDNIVTLYTMNEIFADGFDP